MSLFAVTGITGQVGGEVARSLLEAGHRVRAIVRSVGRGRRWAERGCEIAVADLNDADGLRIAFAQAHGVFVLLPPNFDPFPDFSATRRIIQALDAALRGTRPEVTVCLSSVGAQVPQASLLRQLSLMEEVLSGLETCVKFLRAAWFMENAAWEIDSARSRGEIDSYLQPLDRAIPMVATIDVGRVAAQMLLAGAAGERMIEMTGATEVSPREIASTLGRILGKDVQARSVPRGEWERLFRTQGMKNPLPRIQMLDGINEGWIRFEGEPRRAGTTLETVLRRLVGGSASINRTER